MLIQNAHRQPIDSVNQPLNSGPEIEEMPKTAPMTPMYFERSRTGTTSAMIAWERIMRPPPMPCTVRPMMSQVMSWAAPPMIDPRRRADAERNRERLLVAGASLLREQGDRFAFNAVAEAAGLGAGTLHRHFPTKSLLLLGLYTSDIRRLSSDAQSLLGEHPPLVALERWLTQVAEFAAERPGIADAFRSAARQQDPEIETAYKEVVGALRILLHYAKDEIRLDLGAEDIIVPLCSTWDLPSDEDNFERIRKIVTLILDGLRR